MENFEFSKKNNFVDIIIRHVYKNIDEIKFSCPLNWSIKRIKEFVAQNH